ncbi:ImmA/IrrE family metallo-endopeptidase [Bifidobacterium boum]|uniref:ImmA/IrrE family metallo-endopeptidase n=1 Tax=Bifidobacterium boum TaxID=78343 RepID=UPI003F8DD963
MQTVSMNIDGIQHASVFGAANQAGSFHIASGCSLDSFLDNAGKEHIRIIEQPLPDGLCGAWHKASQTTFLHDRLNQRQRRCTLCHELIHARHHDPGCGSQYGMKCERRCRRETALALISPVDNGMAETVYEGNTWMMAVELGVTIQVLNDYRQLLYDSGVCVQ